MVCVACLVVPLFKSNRRFWISWLPILLPLAARPIASLGLFGPPLRMGRSTFVGLLVLLFLLPHMVRLPRERRSRLQIDKELAQHLLAQGAKRGEIASDIKRFLFFADQDPLPPRRWPAIDLIDRAAEPRTKHVVGYSPSRESILDHERLVELGYRFVPLGGLSFHYDVHRPMVLYSR